MLTTKPARTYLTDRECAKIIGGVLGGLMEMADIETIRSAVRWWADADKSWQLLAMLKDGRPHQPE